MKYLVLYFLCISFFSISQTEHEIHPPDFIKTIIFKSNTNQGELPILKFNDPLTLEFDALNGDEEDFYYVIEHFDYDWNPSSLMKSEYIQGFDYQRIVSYENSFNTYQIYSNYKLQIPNQQTRLKVSGNYILKIYDDYDTLMFSRKFIVYENLANVAVAVKRSRDVSTINEKQSIDFNVNSLHLNFSNPNQNVKALIIQNNNLSTAISDIKPLYTMGNELIYKYDTETSFWGGNEYLFFENKDVRGANIGVQSIDLQNLYHSYLFADLNRSKHPYTYNPDINGNFLVTVLDRDNPSIEADYTIIHFALQYPEQIDGSTIHVYGGFNNYALEPSTKMNFNQNTGLYETTLKLKQGFYNYKYVLVDEHGTLNEGAISGNYNQTENDYKVLIYYRDLGARYDKAIGFGQVNSTNLSH
ncbi:MAG: DUF5103 domain-containing protein [Flavobacteriaceae bacterium]|nr:DUF5103 domain-containing protein [Flavobacteriaceae bacterium]